MSYKNIKLEVEGGIAVLTINRPSTLNILNRETLFELESALSMLDDGTPGAIIITGSGERAFIAGGDIAEMSVMEQEEAKAFSKLGHSVMDLIENHPKPVIAAINGYALGGGCEIALACDIRIAADTAKLGLPEVNLGVIPGWGATQRAARLIGKGRAKELIFTGEVIDAAEAERIGLVNRVVPLADLLSAARELAEKLASKPAAALALAKDAINKSAEVAQTEGMEIEAGCFGRCFATEDRKEGMEAFLKKRKPVFRGR